MRRLKVLTKYFVRDALQDMFNGSKMKAGLMSVLMIVLIAFMSLPFVFIVDNLYEPFKIIGQEGSLLSMILFIGATINFFLGIFIIMNVYYFSNDIEHFLPMPFKGSEIVFSKFAAVLINMYIYSIMIVPPLLVYGQKSGAGGIYYIYILIAFLISPILPMIVAALICMFLMRFTSLSKHKDAFRMVAGCLSLVLIIAFNLLSQNAGGALEDTSGLSTLLQEKNGLMDVVSGFFITNKFASYGLLYSSEAKGFLYIILTLIVCIILCIGYYVIGGKLYLKGVIGISESYSKREDVLKGDKVNKVIRNNSPIKALVIRDIKVIFRTPQFFINCIAMMLYIPVIFFIMYLSNGQLGEITMLISSGKYDSVIVVASFLVAAISITSSGGGRMCLSREGRDFMFSKIIPIPYKVQVKSKIISSLCINIVIPIIVAIFLVVLDVNGIIILLGSILAILGMIIVTLLQLYFDFKNPKLKWEDEKALFKGDFTSVIMVFMIMGLGFGLVMMALGLRSYLGMFTIVATISLVAILSLYKKLINMADDVYNKI